MALPSLQFISFIGMHEWYRHLHMHTSSTSFYIGTLFLWSTSSSRLSRQGSLRATKSLHSFVHPSYSRPLRLQSSNRANRAACMLVDEGMHPSMHWWIHGDIPLLCWLEINRVVDVHTVLPRRWTIDLAARVHSNPCSVVQYSGADISVCVCGPLWPVFTVLLGLLFQ